MIERAILLRKVCLIFFISLSLSKRNKAIEKFVGSEDFTELAKFKLSEADWDALSRFADILEVRQSSDDIYSSDQHLDQKPHAFQQKLSAEATPTLQDALPSFEKLVQSWKKHQHRHPETAHIVAAGLDKIEGYSARASVVDAYMLAMCLFFSPISHPI
jgi:hypothetical protein